MKKFENFRKMMIASILCFAISPLFICCVAEEDEEEAPSEVVVLVPNMPSVYRDRPVVDLGTVEVSTKNVTFKVWDGGGLIDGDIITLVVNGVVVVDEYELLGPSSKLNVPVALNNLGYNYVLLFAHNEGTASPNTASLSIIDASGNEKSLVLDASLTTNGAYNIIVE